MLHIAQQNWRHHVEFSPQFVSNHLTSCSPQEAKLIQIIVIPNSCQNKRFPYLSIPILSTCGTLGDKPEQIWNKLLLLLRNQILSLPFLLKLFICRACTPPPITSWYLANKISFLRLFSKNHVCYNKRSERRKEKLWQAEVSCSSWSCKWVLIIWGQWKIVGFSNPVSGWSVEILTPFATE